MDILIVDDDQGFAQSLGGALELANHKITIADSGESALDMTRRQAFDIALMDKWMYVCRA